MAPKKKPEFKELKDLINSRGYILEDRTVEALEQMECAVTQSLRLRWSNARDPKDRHIEIDAHAILNDCEFIIECKYSSEDSWAFVREKSDRNAVHMLYTYCGRRIRSIILPNRMMPVVRNCIPLRSNMNGWVCNDEPKEPGRVINSKVWQLLKNVDCLLEEDSELYTNMVTIPIIVTNAPILLIEYDKRDVDENGDLMTLDEPVAHPFVALSVSKDLRYGPNLTREVPHMSDVVDANRITVFVVSLRHLHTLIDWLDNFVRLHRDKLFLSPNHAPSESMEVELGHLFPDLMSDTNLFSRNS